MKLRLLENEDHLFDAGLYLGFLGTIIAFILSSVSAKHGFDLMVAYSSTSFGILFVEDGPLSRRDLRGVLPGLLVLLKDPPHFCVRDFNRLILRGIRAFCIPVRRDCW